MFEKMQLFLTNCWLDWHWQQIRRYRKEGAHLLSNGVPPCDDPAYEKLLAYGRKAERHSAKALELSRRSRQFKAA